MKYSEMKHYPNGEVLEGSYIEVAEHNGAKTDAFVHTFTFYKIFYIFMIGSIFGCYMEQVQYFILRGIWECRAGVVWGPFSEIYGVGAVLIYFLYRKMRESTPLTIFGLSAICGSAFEYMARLFQEIVFHSITWDYSKQPFNLGGRTSLKYAIYWGLLGLLFIRWIIPYIDKWLENIKGKMAYVLTWGAILFMCINLVFSAIAVSRWSERLQGVPSGNSMEEYLDIHYNDDVMKERFPHMKFIDVTMNLS